MGSPAVIARLGLASAITICVVNVTLLASAAWRARGLQQKPAIRPLVAKTTPAISKGHPTNPPRLLGVADQPDTLVSRR